MKSRVRAKAPEGEADMTDERIDDDFDDEDDENIPVIEQPEPLTPEDAADAASHDSEVDFDDESDDDVGPIDLVEAREADALLDDPEKLDDEGA